MLKIFILVKFFLLLGGCAYQYTNENNLDIEVVKKIKLNVKSFEINKDNLDIITTLSRNLFIPKCLQSIKKYLTFCATHHVRNSFVKKYIIKKRFLFG